MDRLVVEDRLPVEPRVGGPPDPAARCTREVGGAVAWHARDGRDPVSHGADVAEAEALVLVGGQLLGGEGGGGGQGGGGDGGRSGGPSDEA